MPNYKPIYTVVAIRPHGDVRQIERRFHGSPSDSAIADWLVRQSWIDGGPVSRAVVAVRFFPTAKGWKIINLTHAQQQGSADGRQRFWRNIVKGDRVYPSESAAVMKAIYILNPPSQNQLDL